MEPGSYTLRPTQWLTYSSHADEKFADTPDLAQKLTKYVVYHTCTITLTLILKPLQMVQSYKLTVALFISGADQNSGNATLG
jgi:hypothetical protein